MSVVGSLILWFLFLTPAYAACTGASPTWTSTPDYTSMSSCVASAARGDTINVSAGSATWTNTNLSITKGLRILGAGQSLVTITMSGYSAGSPAITLTPDATAIANEETIKIDGITLNGNNSAANGINIKGTGASGTKAFKNLIITNNGFKNLFGSGSNSIYVTGQVRGVIAANTFDRVAIALQPLGNNVREEWENGNWPFAFDTADNLYFEDNVMTETSDTFGDFAIVTSGQGGRVVVRYNNWNATNNTAANDIDDSHGFQNYIGSPTFSETNGQSGTMVHSTYGNTVTGWPNNFTRLQNIRGSWGLTFNNIVTGAASTMSINATQYDRGCNAWQSNTWPPPNGQINNTYTFNNTFNGTAKGMTINGPSGTPNGPSDYNNTCAPVENSQFWNLDTTNCTSSACTQGIGQGTTAPTGTCTVGTGYWVASTATPTVSSSVIQAGVLYKCTSTNVWTSYFTPYTYPHPLRGGADTTPPSAPIGLRAF